MLVGENRVFPIRDMQSSVSRENFASLSNSAISNNTFSSLDSSISKDYTIKNQGSAEKSFLKSKKKTNVKEAVIAEEDYERKDTINKSDILSSSHLGKNILYQMNI